MEKKAVIDKLKEINNDLYKLDRYALMIEKAPLDNVTSNILHVSKDINEIKSKLDYLIFWIGLGDDEIDKNNKN